jgi:hypothetical protein
LKSASSANLLVMNYEGDILLYEGEVDKKVKRCNTLDEERICRVKVNIFSRSPTSNR